MYQLTYDMKKEWIYEYIYKVMKAKYGPFPREVQYNLENDHWTNLRYLGTYFPRSYLELSWILSSLCTNEFILGKLNSSNDLNILSVGTGTGGEIIGTILFLTDDLDNGPNHIHITTVEGNLDALGIFDDMVKEINTRYLSKKGPDYVTVTHCNTTVNPEDGFPTFHDQLFDLVITSKFVNELHREYPGYIWYSEFLREYANNLADDGLFIFTDLTNRVDYPPSSDGYEWIPVVLNREINYFLKKHDDFVAIFPVPCRKNNFSCRNCYTRFGLKILTFNNDTDESQFTCKVITKRDFTKNLSDVPDGRYDIGSSQTDCWIGHKSQRLNGFDFKLIAGINQDE